MIIRYTKDNKIESIITFAQMILNPILAIFNLALITIVDCDTNRVLAINKFRYGQLFTQRFNVIGNYKFYYNILKNNKAI